MEEGQNIQPLDYQGPPPRPWKYRETPEEKQWRYRRYWLRAGMFALIGPIVVYCGSNFIMFGKLTRLTAADYVPTIQSQCVTAVAAIKRYQRDNGHLPNAFEDLVPKYFPQRRPWDDFSMGQYRYWHIGPGQSMIMYDFPPALEGWSVRGYFVNGPIPAALVQIDSRGQVITSGK